MLGGDTMLSKVTSTVAKLAQCLVHIASKMARQGCQRGSHNGGRDNISVPGVNKGGLSVKPLKRYMVL